MTEYDLHANVAEYIRRQYPGVIFLSHLAGLKLPVGLAVKAARLQGSRGLPDMVIFQARKGYHGLTLELKRDRTELYTKDGQPRQTEHLEEQRRVLAALEECGYCARFACGFEEAKAWLDWYLG